jgi:hypothetical protein
VTYFHVLWTQPQLNPSLAPEAQDLLLWDFEILTWLLSALEARRHGLLKLVTDSRGAQAAEKAGLAALYSAGVSTALDELPKELDPAIFWAGGKLYAYRAVEAPCVCMDLDAVLWQPVRPVSPVMGLHSERKDWLWYHNDQELFEGLGFAGPGWNWDLDPFNTGAVYLGNAEAARLYTDTAISFMERCSRAMTADPSLRKPFHAAMLFAEQRLLPMCAHRLGIAVAPLTSVVPTATGLPISPECLHLWRSKVAYKVCREARLALVNWLILRIRDTFPEAKPILQRLGLDQARTNSETGTLDASEIEQAQVTGLRFSLLRNVRGTISVADSTSGARRQALEDSMVWSGEVIQPEPGASFEIEMLGAPTGWVRATAWTTQQ